MACMPTTEGYSQRGGVFLGVVTVWISLIWVVYCGSLPSGMDQPPLGCDSGSFLVSVDLPHWIDYSGSLPSGMDQPHWVVYSGSFLVGADLPHWIVYSGSLPSGMDQPHWVVYSGSFRVGVDQPHWVVYSGSRVDSEWNGSAWLSCAVCFWL